jgi:two-component system, OmpR family, catabolic regulation response regulator CreB
MKETVMSQQIMVVDDEPSIADTILYALRTEGFTGIHVSTGIEAIEKLKGGQIALVVMDIGLPDGSGMDHVRRIRTFSDVPVIFLTARADEIDRVLGLELGADDYVVKPFSPRELVARVKAVLRRKTSANVSREKANVPFEIDDARMIISFFGQPLNLSRYEYRLLAVLLKNPGHVFTRERLMDLAWEEPEMSLERTVDTHIKTIRSKLKQIRPEEEAIITHRGVGYSLRCDW